MPSIKMSMIVEFLTLPLILALPRILAAIYMVGILPKNIPIYARGSLGVAVGLLAQPVVADQIYAVEDPPFVIYAIIALKEVFIGVIIGFLFSMVLRILETAGGILDFQSGASNASIIDPVTNSDTGPYGRLMLQLGIVLFIVSGGLSSMIRLLVDSFRTWPVMSFYPRVGPAFLEFLIDYIATLFHFAVVIGMSIGLLLLMVELGIGFINRVTPQLNVFTFAMGIKSLLVAAILIAAIPFIFDSLKPLLGGQSLSMPKLNAVFADPRPVVAPTPR